MLQVSPAPLASASHEPSQYVTLEFGGGATSTDVDFQVSAHSAQHPTTRSDSESSADEVDRADYLFPSDDGDEPPPRPIRTHTSAPPGTALHILSSTQHVEYADISELKTLALQRAMRGQGTLPDDGGVAGARQVRRRRTRHDTAPEEREQLQPMYATWIWSLLQLRLMLGLGLSWKVSRKLVRSTGLVDVAQPSSRCCTEVFPSGSGDVDDLLRDIDNLYDEVWLGWAASCNPVIMAARCAGGTRSCESVRDR